MKKITVDKTSCFGCGLCAQINQELFVMGDDGLSKLKNGTTTATESTLTTESVDDTVNEAVEGCPAGAISVEEVSN